MGRASSSKKVTRAAMTGGGRTTGPARPYAFYGAISLVVVIGLVLILSSRQERRDELAVGKGTVPPIANKDHWHSAYGVYLCDSFAPPITDQRDPKGIHTHGDGVIHIHPFVRSAAGRNATLGVFTQTVKMTLTDSTIKLPGGKTYREGKDKCGGKDGEVVVKVNDRVVTTDVAGIRMKDRDLITIGFVAKGTGKDLPPPTSAGQLDNLSDVPQSQQQGGATPGATTAGTGQPSGQTTTGAPEGGGTGGGGTTAGTTGATEATTGATPTPAP